MVAMKLNYAIERAVIVFVCLWGNWALYYWAMVLIGDASYVELKQWSPLLLLQIPASLLILFRLELGTEQSQSSRCAPIQLLSGVPQGRRFYLLVLAATVSAAAIVLAVFYFNLSLSSIAYNMLWVLLLPASVAYLLHFKKPLIETASADPRAETSVQTLDILLLLIAGALLIVNLYGKNVPTYDDAFYANVISSTLANPELPVQGQDILLNSNAPYTLHPAYRLVGYEVLIALASDLSNLDPLYLYYDIFPIFSALFWIPVAYLFMRNLGTPYPGLAVTVSLVTMLFWSTGFAPGGTLVFLNWGKNAALLIVAPLSFVAVSVFIRYQSMRSWFLLFLVGSAVGILSSSALFLVPMSFGLACLVYLQPKLANIRLLFLTLASLSLFVLLMAYTVITLHHAPSHTAGFNAGYIALEGQAFGGIVSQALVLVMLFLLPLAARTVGNSVFQVQLYKICLIGIFTVMSPYLTELIAVVSGTKLLSWRLYYALPAMLLVGVMASIAVAHLKPYRGFTTHRPARLAIITMTVMFYTVFFVSMEKVYLFGPRTAALEIFQSDFEEAKAARALIPDGAFVAAGDLDDILPILPNPPTFIQSKYYLSFHKHFIPRDDFRRRDHLYRVLKNRLPREGKGEKESLKWIVVNAEKLGVNTIVFHTVGGRHRPYIRTNYITPRSPETDIERAAFISALVAQLQSADYDCTMTPSERTWVCNRKTTATSAHSTLPVLRGRAPTPGSERIGK